MAISIIIVWSIVIWMLLDGHSKNENAFLDIGLKRFEGEVNSTLLTYKSFSNYIFDEISQDEEIISIIDQANTASTEEKTILRRQLYSKLYRKYSRMKKYEFRQLHFHLPNTESFLRVHAPDKYGDLLLDVRESVRIANEEIISITGFEEGRIFNGFRHVYPLGRDTRHIGSVEISLSSCSIIEVLSKLYIDENFYFIIEKAAVEENVFYDEMTNYKKSSIFEDYYADKEVNEITTLYNNIIGDDEEEFFRGLKEKHSERLKNKESFSSLCRFKGRDYTVKFLSIKNTKEIPIAYLISISESVGYKKFNKDMYEEIALVTLLALFIIAFGLVLAFYQHKIKKVSQLDYLTKIYNRNKFYEMAEKEARVSKRYKYESSVMLMDIDFFKKINDTYGHAWGDKVLKELANQILSNIRETDIFARWGGEEFVLLLPHTGKEEVLIVAEKIRALIDESQSKELKGVTISIGATTIDFENSDIDNAIKIADEAMYCAKENGRNYVCYK